jgi:hypothetical protein
MVETIDGTVSGVMTFDYVEIAPKEDTTTVVVIGTYDGDLTHFECDQSQVLVGGLRLRATFDAIQLEPDDEDEWVEVEATSDELRITSEKP